MDAGREGRQVEGRVIQAVRVEIERAEIRCMGERGKVELLECIVVEPEALEDWGGGQGGEIERGEGVRVEG